MWRLNEGNKVGVNPVYITQIEKHDMLPSHEVFRKIEDALHLPQEIYNLYVCNKYYGSSRYKFPRKLNLLDFCTSECVKDFMRDGNENSPFSLKMIKEII